jgi:DNA-binding CsgD family transcriptional regulator
VAPEVTPNKGRDRHKRTNFGPTIASLVRIAVVRFAGHYRLSTRETSALHLAAMGVHRKETAAHLGCGIATVDTYWRRVLRKTGLTSQMEVLAALLNFALGEELRTEGRGTHGRHRRRPRVR